MTTSAEPTRPEPTRAGSTATGGPGGAPTLVALNNVAKTFGSGAHAVTALDDVSLTIASGEFFTLLGPSGCGKTTLLRLFAGFEHPDVGDVLLEGRSMLGDPPNRRPVNTVFQSYALFPHMSVADNVAFGLENLNTRGDERTARVDAMLKLVRLETMAERRPAELSGGQQQRVALARALAPAPKLLLLDEPMSALDPKLRRGMHVELKRIQRETGITFLLVTHDQEEALSMSDRIAVMDAGRVSQIGTPADIYERPTSRFVADFMGAAVLPGACVGLTAPYAAIRPEAVAITRQGDPSNASVSLPGRVASVTFLGARTACSVAIETGETIGAERDDMPGDLAIGDRVVCHLPRAALVALET